MRMEFFSFERPSGNELIIIIRPTYSVYLLIKLRAIISSLGGIENNIRYNFDYSLTHN